MTIKYGKIYAVGIGPGSLDLISHRAENAIVNSDTIIGYSLYIEQIEKLVNGKEVVCSGMTKEIDRCKLAFKKAKDGKIVSIVSSGDSGVYGMAGLLYELKEDQGNSEIELEVIPGITAANAAAAILGAPLMNDFAVISLSDLLTPKNVILKRIKHIAESGVVCSLYNPMSKSRKEIFPEVVKIFLEYRGNQYVGIVKNASREKEESFVTTLKDVHKFELDMRTLVIIGNNSTVLKNNKLYTARGYREKYIENFK